MTPNHPTWSPFKEYVSLDMGAQNISLASIPAPKSISAGPEVLSQSEGVVNSRNYVAYFLDGDLFVRAENATGSDWEEPVLLGRIAETPNTLSLSFDQLGRPQIFYEVNSEIRLFGYDPTSQTVTSRFICNGITPIAAMDYPNNTSRASCDILLAYVINNKAKFRLQRDKYQVEYVVMDESPGDNLRMYESGFRRDRRFGITFTYKPR